MKINNESIKFITQKVGFWIKKNAPEILISSGILTSAASIILGCKATTKADSILRPANKKIKKLHEDLKDDNAIANNIVDVKETKKELIKVYTKTGVELTKIYAPTIISFSLSIACILSSHKILKGRNLALAAAYTTLENGYLNYRNRVKAKIGEKAEEEIYKNIYEEDVSTIITDKNGNEKEVTKKMKVAHIDDNSDFSYLFDASNPNWSKNARLNFDFLSMTEKYLNQKLKAHGYLFLDEVYNALGIESGIIGPRKLQASKVLGWIYDPDDSNCDNYISFGLFDEMGNYTKGAMDMIRNGETNIWLEFNPDGDILTGDIDSSTGLPKKTFMKFAKI